MFELFITFMMIGLVSFGGGYAMIPLIQEEAVNRNGWLSLQQFTDVIAVAGMSPGPIATNIAIFIGFKVAGLPGAVIATIGMIVPSFILIILIGMVFFKFQHNSLMQSSFYGLRPVITGLIVYSVIMLAISNGMLTSLSWFTMTQMAIYLGSLSALLFFGKHPLTIIVISGLVGIAIYS